jgi:DNA polymerase III sliding clamp (beta) subunit (PCNA family)
MPGQALIIDRRAFARQLRIVKQLEGTRQSQRMLFTGVWLEAAGNNLKISATNPAAAFEVTLQGQGELDVPCCCHVDIASLHEFIRRAKTDNITLRPYEKTVGAMVLEAGDQFLVALPVDAPGFPSVPDDMALTVPGDIFRAAWQRVLPALDFPDSNRPILENARLYIEADGQATLWGTDSFRLHTTSFLVGAVPYALEALIPGEAVKFLANSLPDEPVSFAFLDGCMFVWSASWRAIVRLVAGKYPDLGHILQSHRPDVQIMLKRRVLQEAIRQCKPYARKDHDAMHFLVKGDQMILGADAYENVLSVSILPIKANLDSQFAYFVLNGRFVQDVLDLLSGEDVSLYLQLSVPVLWHGVKIWRTGFAVGLGDSVTDMSRFLIMPMGNLDKTFEQYASKIVIVQEEKHASS